MSSSRWASIGVATVIILTAAGAAPDPSPDPNSVPSASSSSRDEVAGQPEAAPISLRCDFCKTPQPEGVFFCTHCGRLSRLRHLDAKARFWGDAFYVLAYPPAEDSAALAADFNDRGLVRESATSYSGERYVLDPLAKKGVVITGDVMAWGTSRAVSYRATVQDAFDGGNRITLREIRGVVKAEPVRHLYRRIEYAYEGDLLDRIEIGTWLYRGDDDWKKRPSEWVRHDRAEVSLIYAGGALGRIETTRREGRKGLRGNLEYVDLPGITEVVQVEDGSVIAIRRSTP